MHGRVFDVYTCVTEYVLHAGEPYGRLAEFALRLREHARAGGALRGEAFGTTLLGEVELLTGDPQAARTHLFEAAALSRKAGAIGGEALARARLGEALTHLGERSAAREQLEEALALAHASALAGHLLFIVHGPLLRLAEDRAEALARVDRAEALLDETPTASSVLSTTTSPAQPHALTPATPCVLTPSSLAWSRRPDSGTAAMGPGSRQAIAGYATAGQRLNEARARRSLGEHLASPRPATKGPTSPHSPR